MRGIMFDRTYCASPKCNNECGRQLTDHMKKIMEERDKQLGYEHPLSMGYFCGEPNEKTETV